MKIRLDNVIKTFDTFRAVHGVSLEIESGELVALLGPSGSGKTTILRMVAGLEYADGGHIHFGDQDATDIPVRDRGVGFVFQHYALFPHMTVSENIGFGLKMLGKPRAEIDARVGAMLKLVRMEQFAKRQTSQLSGGQQQMVAIGRALMSNPEVLLCDELSLGLAPVVIKDIYAAFPRIRETGAAIVIVEQDIAQALKVADRVYCMMEGRVTLEGRPADLDRTDIHAAYFGAEPHELA